jgi:membrane fusion protein (multidrug efflux system)
MVVLLGSLLAGCERSTDAVTKKEPVPTVQVTRAHKGEIVRRITLPGSVRAYQEAILYAKVAGYLKTITVDKGDFVEEGRLLAEIEAPEMLDELGRYKAEATMAAADLKRIREAREKAPDLVMPQTADAAVAKNDTAVANLKRVETLLGYAKITAPFSGVVTRRWVDPGAFIPAATSSTSAKNAAVVTLMDFRRVRIDVSAPESEVPRIRKDLAAHVTVEELPGRTFEGAISRLAYALDDSTRTMALEVELPNPDLDLRPGMYASVEIALERKPDAVLIPAEALVMEKNKAFVYSLAGERAKKIAVKTGFDDGVSVEILEGLSPDETVILAGKQAVSDGEEVRGVERQ